LFDVSTAQSESKNVDKLEEFVENDKLNESIKQKSYSDVISMQGFYKIFFCWILSTFFIVGGFPVLKTGEYFSLIRKVRETRPLQMSKTLKPYNFSKWGQEQKKLETTIGFRLCST